MYIVFFAVLQLQLARLKKEVINYNKEEQNLIFINQDINIANNKINKNLKNKLKEAEKNENKLNKKIEKLYSKLNNKSLEIENINLSEREKIFNKEFRKMFKKRTNWSLETQKQVCNLIKEAGIYDDDFFKKIDKIVKIALNRINLKNNGKKYDKKYYLYFLQASMQIKFFNRNMKINQERWQTGLQSFITEKNINKIREMVEGMDDFIKEVNFKENINHDTIVVLGSTLTHIKNRMSFVYEELIKEIEKENFKNKKQIIILTSDRAVFNNKKVNKIIKKANSYNEIEDIVLTKEQKDFVKFYRNNNLSLKHFKKNYKKITENTAGEIIVKEMNDKLKNYKNINIEILKTGNKKISNGIFGTKYKRADTIDTVKTLLKKYSNFNYNHNIVFVTNQPYIQSQKAQIETVFENKEFEIVGEGIANINNDTIKIILQNIAGVINSNFEISEKENYEAVEILKIGIEYLKLLEYKKTLIPMS